MFRTCKAYHSLEEGRNDDGPSLNDIVGRTAGVTDGSPHSDEITASGIVWFVETPAGFLAMLNTYVKGTSMAFPGLKKDGDLDDVIAYLFDVTNR